MPLSPLGIFGWFKPNEVLTPGILWVASKKLFLAEEGRGNKRPGTEHSVVLNCCRQGRSLSRARLSGP